MSPNPQCRAHPIPLYESNNYIYYVECLQSLQWLWFIPVPANKLATFGFAAQWITYLHKVKLMVLRGKKNPNYLMWQWRKNVILSIFALLRISLYWQSPMADDLSTVACGGPPTGKTAGNQGCVTFFCAPPKCSIFLSHHGSIRNEYVATRNTIQWCQ